MTTKKTRNKNILILSWAMSLSAPVFCADSIVTGVTTELKDHTNGAILIQKNPGLIQPNDFEIVSGTDEITGDPSAGHKDAYASWKTACAEWKKDLRETNKENSIVAMNCGSPKQEAQKDVAIGTYVYKSMATYKIKVRIRIQK